MRSYYAAGKKMRRNPLSVRSYNSKHIFFAANLVLLSVVSGYVLTSQSSTQTNTTASYSALANTSVQNPLDKLSSADIAFTIAQMTDLQESAAVAHEKDAETTRVTIASADPLVTAKPNIITTDIKTLSDIVEHTVVESDSIESLSNKYRISKDAIRWSNGIGPSQKIEVGSVLVMPPIEGVVYDVVAGDTVEDLAREYRTDVDKIVAFNDTEISGLQPNTRIVIPGGELIRSSPSSYTYSFSAVYSGNSYALGNCTWHVANRWAAFGKSLPGNLGNAATWVSRAKQAGLETGKIPRLHAVIQTSTAGYGHVGFVEEVYADGSIRMSEMNYNWRLYALRDRIVPAAEALSYNYIY
jgi:peptidoglycan endopeptidase LytE